MRKLKQCGYRAIFRALNVGDSVFLEKTQQQITGVLREDCNQFKVTGFYAFTQRNKSDAPKIIKLSKVTRVA